MPEIEISNVGPSYPQSKWEYFCDRSYYDMWCVRKIGEKRFGFCFHVPTQYEAKELSELLMDKNA
jgi:hypothetical protein